MRFLARADEAPGLAQTVLLTDDDPLVAKDVVGAHDMEIEVRQRPRRAGTEGTVHVDHPLVWECNAAVAVFRTVEGTHLGELQILDGVRDPIF